MKPNLLKHTLGVLIFGALSASSLNAATFTASLAGWIDSSDSRSTVGNYLTGNTNNLLYAGVLEFSLPQFVETSDFISETLVRRPDLDRVATDPSKPFFRQEAFERTQVFGIYKIVLGSADTFLTFAADSTDLNTAAGETLNIVSPGERIFQLDYTDILLADVIASTVVPDANGFRVDLGVGFIEELADFEGGRFTLAMYLESPPAESFVFGFTNSPRDVTLTVNLDNFERVLVDTRTVVDIFIVPEPSALSLLVLGAGLGLVALRRRR